MSTKWDYLSKLADYLRVDNNLVQAISKLEKNDSYYFVLEKQQELNIFKKNITIRQFKYRLTLPAFFHTSKWEMLQQDIIIDTIVDFIVTFKGKEKSLLDEHCIRFFSGKQLVCAEAGLFILLAITMFPNWSIGVYPNKKGENKN